MNVSNSWNRLYESTREGKMGTKTLSFVGDNPVTSVLSYPEWIIQVKAAKSMLECFPHMFTTYQKELFHTRREMSVIESICSIARGAKKCKELNSIDFLTKPIRTLEGLQKVTYYSAGDVVFVTVPGNREGQKLVTMIFSLTDKLGRLEATRRAAEKSGGRRGIAECVPKMKRLHKSSKRRGYFKNKH